MASAAAAALPVRSPAAAESAGRRLPWHMSRRDTDHSRCFGGCFGTCLLRSRMGSRRARSVRPAETGSRQGIAPESGTRQGKVRKRNLAHCAPQRRGCHRPSWQVGQHLARGTPPDSPVRPGAGWSISVERPDSGTSTSSTPSQSLDASHLLRSATIVLADYSPSRPMSILRARFTP